MIGLCCVIAKYWSQPRWNERYFDHHFDNASEAWFENEDGIEYGWYEPMVGFVSIFCSSVISPPWLFGVLFPESLLLPSCVCCLWCSSFNAEKEGWSCWPVWLDQENRRLWRLWSITGIPILRGTSLRFPKTQLNIITIIKPLWRSAKLELIRKITQSRFKNALLRQRPDVILWVRSVIGMWWSRHWRLLKLDICVWQQFTNNSYRHWKDS